MKVRGNLKKKKILPLSISLKNLGMRKSNIHQIQSEIMFSLMISLIYVIVDISVTSSKLVEEVRPVKVQQIKKLVTVERLVVFCIRLHKLL